MSKIELVRDGDPSEDAPVGIYKSWTTEKGIKKTVFLWFTEEEAQHLSNRLQSFAKSQGPLRETIKED